MEIKKVYGRKDDGVKLITIPKNSDIEVGDYVKIIKIKQTENVTGNETSPSTPAN